MIRSAGFALAILSCASGVVNDPPPAPPVSAIDASALRQIEQELLDTCKNACELLASFGCSFAGTTGACVTNCIDPNAPPHVVCAERDAGDAGGYVPGSGGTAPDTYPSQACLICGGEPKRQ